MKKLTTLWMMVVMLVMSLPASAMSKAKVRENARFLTDRMAYELNLSRMQYDDVYEVNYDFIDNVRHIMDDVVRGYGYAVDRYYDFLDYRNDDLRWILNDAQYRRFMGVDYFYRPIYTTPTNWMFRIYRVYTDVHHFHFGKPHHYKTYKGGHYRTHFGHVSYYKTHRHDHYKHNFYQGNVRQVRPHKAPHMKPGHAPSKPKPGVKPKQPSRQKTMKGKGEDNRRKDVKRRDNVRTRSHSEAKDKQQEGRRASRGR